MLNSQERDFLLDRISSGQLALKYNGKTYFYKYPSPKRRYRSNLKYQEIIDNNVDILSTEDVISILTFLGKWDDKMQEEIDIHIPKVVENLKLDIFQAYKQDRRYIPAIKVKLERVKARLMELLSIKHQYDDYTIESLARKEQTLYLLDKGIDSLDISPELLVNQFYSSSIPEEHIRELARSGEWIPKWTALKKGIMPFTKNITDDQERLVRWTSLYESILEGQDSPNDDILDDDDALDGYLIWRRRENERQKNVAQLDKVLGGEKKGSTDVFIMARDFEHAKEINSLNTPDAIRQKQQRFEQIDKEGSVRELHFTDQKIAIQLAKNRMS